MAKEKNKMSLRSREKPKPLDKWKLSPKARAVVEKELLSWLHHFENEADGMVGNVYRCDFINWDFFYFTDCKDILDKKPESNAVEGNKLIMFRKDQVFMQLFVKTLLGKLDILKPKCSHCGGTNTIESIYNGHMWFCPNCGKTDVSVYPNTAYKSFSDAQKKIWEWSSKNEE